MPKCSSVCYWCWGESTVCDFLLKNFLKPGAALVEFKIEYAASNTPELLNYSYALATLKLKSYIFLCCFMVK